MSLVTLAVFCSALSLISGILAVGKGHHWHFSIKDILAGKQNALLYIWVTFSSCFALGHLTQLTLYGIEFNWAYRDADTSRWMIIHSSIGLLLTFAHIHIVKTLNRATCTSLLECPFDKKVSNADLSLWNSK